MKQTSDNKCSVPGNEDALVDVHRKVTMIVVATRKRFDLLLISDMAIMMSEEWDWQF